MCYICGLVLVLLNGTIDMAQDFRPSFRRKLAKVIRVQLVHRGKRYDPRTHRSSSRGQCIAIANRAVLRTVRTVAMASLEAPLVAE